MSYSHWILCAFYALVPAATLFAVLVRARRKRSFKPILFFLLSCISGGIIGAVLAIQYGRAVAGHVSAAQVMLAGYFCVSMMLVLKAFNWGLEQMTTSLFGVREMPKTSPDVLASPTPPDSTAPQIIQPPLRFGPARIIAAAVTRAVVLFTFGLPYVMALVMLYRPRALGEDPQQILGFGYQRVSFNATDGTPIDAFWIPAAARANTRSEAHWGERAVVLCHGLAANKSNQLILAQDLVPNGYNVLAFDFRAHGGSGGQLTTFGDLERRDVLGAVHWIRAHRAKGSQRIFGVGASMGAAALIAAAADPGEDGQAIEAIAAYGAYDSLGGLTESIARDYFPRPLQWLTLRIALPLASLHAGLDLADFSPARESQQLWPRPILVIHGHNDLIIDFGHGQKLYDAALQPKLHLWIDRADHNSIVADPDIARSVRQFFDTAQSIL